MIIELDSAYVTHEIALYVIQDIYATIEALLRDTDGYEVVIVQRSALENILKMIEDSNR